MQETVTPPCLRMARLYSLLLVPASGASTLYNFRQRVVLTARSSKRGI